MQTIPPTCRNIASGAGAALSKGCCVVCCCIHPLSHLLVVVGELFGKHVDEKLRVLTNQRRSESETDTSRPVRRGGGHASFCRTRTKRRCGRREQPDRSQVVQDPTSNKQRHRMGVHSYAVLYSSPEPKSRRRAITMQQKKTCNGLESHTNAVGYNSFLVVGLTESVLICLASVKTLSLSSFTFVRLPLWARQTPKGKLVYMGWASSCFVCLIVDASGGVRRLKGTGKKGCHLDHSKFAG